MYKTIRDILLCINLVLLILGFFKALSLVAIWICGGVSC